MSNQDSFIDEVTEEIRRDRLFTWFRRYGWIVAALVVLVVAGAAYNEYRKASRRAAAQELGERLSAALDRPEPAARAEALAAIAPEGEQLVILDLLRASEAEEAGDLDVALDALNRVAVGAEAPYYRDLAILKREILTAPRTVPDERIAALQPLTTPGAPYRLLAEEQIAIAEVDAGDRDAALDRLLAILSDNQATESLRRRVAQLVVALGGDLDAG